MTTDSASPTGVTLGYYVVGFFDLLGQQDYLRAMRRLPMRRCVATLRLVAALAGSPRTEGREPIQREDLGEFSNQVTHGARVVHKGVILPFAVHCRRAINERIAGLVGKVDQLAQRPEVFSLRFIPCAFPPHELVQPDRHCSERQAKLACEGLKTMLARGGTRD